MHHWKVNSYTTYILHKLSYIRHISFGRIDAQYKVIKNYEIKFPFNFRICFFLYKTLEFHKVLFKFFINYFFHSFFCNLSYRVNNKKVISFSLILEYAWTKQKFSYLIIFILFFSFVPFCNKTQTCCLWVESLVYIKLWAEVM